MGKMKKIADHAMERVIKENREIIKRAINKVRQHIANEGVKLSIGLIVSMPTDSFDTALSMVDIKVHEGGNGKLIVDIGFIDPFEIIKKENKYYLMLNNEEILL